MATTALIPEITQFLTTPDAAAIRRLEVQPIEDLTLVDAEEEEFAELWASDHGNQGA